MRYYRITLGIYMIRGYLFIIDENHYKTLKLVIIN